MTEHEWSAQPNTLAAAAIAAVAHVVLRTSPLKLLLAVAKVGMLLMAALALHCMWQSSMSGFEIHDACADFFQEEEKDPRWVPWKVLLQHVVQQPGGSSG